MAMKSTTTGRVTAPGLMSLLRRSIFNRGASAGKNYGVDQSWTVLVFGVPPDRRAEFDDLFPEFRKTFISRTAPNAVVKRHFRATGQKVALCWGASPPPSLTALCERFPDLQKIFIYHGPFDIVGDQIYRSYALDWTGLYVNPRRGCDFEYLANVFPFEKNARLVEASGELRVQMISASARPAAATVSVLLQDRSDLAFALADAASISQSELVKLAAAENPGAPIALVMAASSSAQTRLFDQVRSELDAETLARIASVGNESDMFDLMLHSAKVYTVSAPFGALAVLAGRPVVNFGSAFYAGWGLTEDRATILRRQRRLTIDEFSALVFGLYFRWIADDGSLLFPGIAVKETA